MEKRERISGLSVVSGLDNWNVTIIGIVTPFRVPIGWCQIVAVLLAAVLVC